MGGVFGEIMLDNYYDPHEWQYDMRMFPTLANPEAVRDEGAEPIIKSRIGFQVRRRMVAGQIIPHH